MHNRPLIVAALLIVSAAACWSIAAAGPQPWSIVKVELPAGDESFPAGVGADIAANQCLICHSAGMVLRQPPLTKSEWRAEIVKMRSAYGAPVPDEQVEALSEYLNSINGRK
jgi:mono/diheme cytochrome c family protein